MTTMCVSGWMFLLVPADPQCPEKIQNAIKRSCVCVCVSACVRACMHACMMHVCINIRKLKFCISCHTLIIWQFLCEICAVVTKAPCGLQDECPAGKYSYVIRSGVERDGNPTVCFNGHMYVNSVNRAGHIDSCSRCWFYAVCYLNCWWLSILYWRFCVTFYDIVSVSRMVYDAYSSTYTLSCLTSLFLWGYPNCAGSHKETETLVIIWAVFTESMPFLLTSARAKHWKQNETTVEIWQVPQQPRVIVVWQCIYSYVLNALQGV